MGEFPLNQIGLAVIPGIVFLAIIVALIYAPRVGKRRTDQWSAQDWLLFGIFTGTLLPVLTNMVYWGVHFFSVWTDDAALTNLTWKWGQFANFFTRYGWYMISLPAHLMAAYKMSELSGRLRMRHPVFYVVISLLISGAAYLALGTLRP